MATKKVNRKVRPAIIEETIVEQSSSMPRRPMPKILLVVPLIIALLFLLIWKNKGWFVAATVNNQPIWRWDLEQRFVSRFGTQTLDEMVNEQILKNEAGKQGINVSEQEINNKVSEIEKTLTGKVTLKEALTQQGMTLDDFRRQVQIQILIEKLTANKVTVSDKEITDYVDKNKDSLTATDDAGMRDEAKTAILQGKRNETFQKLFENLKKSAKVTKFL